MGMVRAAARRARVTMLGQLAVSITATIAATLILTGLQHEVAVFGPATSRPELTSGGKFAARVDAMRASADTLVPAVPAPPSLPLLVAAAASHDVNLSLASWDSAESLSFAGEPPRAAKRSARVEAHRRAVMEASLSVTPPRRSEGMGVEDSRPNSALDVDGTLGSIWSTTRGFSKQALSLGVTVLDLVNPANLLP